MNNASRLFEKFESRNPSWIPIIVLSGLGILGTVICARTIAAIEQREIERELDKPSEVANLPGRSSVDV